MSRARDNITVFLTVSDCLLWFGVAVNVKRPQHCDFWMGVYFNQNARQNVYVTDAEQT